MGGREKIILDGNGGCDVSLKIGWNGPLGGKLVPDGLFDLSREDIDEGVIRPEGFEVYCDVLKRND